MLEHASVLGHALLQSVATSERIIRFVGPAHPVLATQLLKTAAEFTLFVVQLMEQLALVPPAAGSNGSGGGAAGSNGGEAGAGDPLCTPTSSEHQGLVACLGALQHLLMPKTDLQVHFLSGQTIQLVLQVRASRLEEQEDAPPSPCTS